MEGEVRTGTRVMTYSWEVTQGKDTQQTRLSTSTVTNDDQFSSIGVSMVGKGSEIQAGVPSYDALVLSHDSG